MKLNSEVRNPGKKEARKLRKDNKIPAILYGKEFAPVPLSLNYKEFYNCYKQSLGHQSFIFLNVNDKEHRTLIKELQIDPYFRRIVHVDFQEVYAGQKIEVKIPITLAGDSPGVIEGGIAEIHLRELDIRCLPKDLPDSFEADVSQLQIGDALHVEDLLSKMKNVEVLNDPNAPIVSIVLPKLEKVEEAIEEIEEEEEAVDQEIKERKEEKPDETEKQTEQQ